MIKYYVFTIIHTKGLIFIVYLSDVQDGEFQYIEGSHAWSEDDDHSDYSSDSNPNNGRPAEALTPEPLTPLPNQIVD